MIRLLALIAGALLLAPASGQAQDGRVTLERVARALGASNVRSLEYTGSGLVFAVGQNAAPTVPWPRFNLKSFTRAVNYETASLRDDLSRTQAEDPPRGGSQQPLRGEQRQIFVVSGESAWNVAGDTATPAPIALAERQLQLWTTPHGLIKAAMAMNAKVQGQTIVFIRPGRFSVRATVNAQNLVDKVEATVAHPVLGDMPVEVRYSDYRDVGGVKFMKIHQAVGAFPRWSWRSARSGRMSPSTSRSPTPSGRRRRPTPGSPPRWWPTGCGTSPVARITARSLR